MLKLEYPIAIVLSLLPLVIWYFSKHTERHFKASLQVPFAKTLLQLKHKNNQGLNTKYYYILFLSFICFVIALANPYTPHGMQNTSKKHYDIMMVLDVSPSMAIQDMPSGKTMTSRLNIVKNAATLFVKSRSADNIGLILFGERAFLLTPLTFDKKAILNRLDDATAGLAGNTTSIGDAIGLAVKRMQNIKAESKVIILLTDGVNNSGILSPLKAAKIAKLTKIKIYTIGLGATGTLNNNMLRMRSVQNAELDEETLQKIADITNGLYFRATSLSSLEKIYQDIDKLNTNSTEIPAIPKTSYKDYFIIIGMLVLLYLTLGPRP
jgi:Ca-activated chloride channel homolog